jgi:hypothetical protein
VELIAVVLMVIAGGAIAVFVMIASAIARREEEAAPRPPSQERDHLAASLLFHVVAASGASTNDAMRAVRRGAGLAAPVTTGIDVLSWADRYARLATPQQRAGLLETAVQLLHSPIPVRQYAALLDLSFGLGFHTDALAKLREIYGFEYVDHAKDARPRHADRAGGGAPLFVREKRERSELLDVLGVSGTPSRQEITAAYRRLVALHHPDRFHAAPERERAEAAARFIDITRAYEELLLVYRE